MSLWPTAVRALRMTNSFEKEKQDYVYCLESSLQTYNPDYVLMVEDDPVSE